MTSAARVSLTIGTAVVALIAIAGAASRLAGYAADPYQLWQDLDHDRNGHFSYGLELALALRDLDPADVLQHLARSVVWPPLHGLVLAAIMLTGGIDLRLAIVPSLIGWSATIVLVWLIGIRLFPDPRRGIAAGAIAVAFASMSPAFRLITADVMLEGLGAALSCLSVYCYLRARETPEQPLWWRLLALALTALFFEKFNYWLLTLLPLALAFVLDEPQRMRAILARLRDGAVALRGECRDPLIVAFIVVLAVVIAIWVHGPLALQMFGLRISLYPPGNLLTLAYALLFIRVMLAWRRHRDAFDSIVGPALRQLACWHALPVAASLLIPKRLAPFLWFIGPTHHHGAGYNPWRAALAQWDAFASAFHVARWAGVLAGVGILLALAMLRRAGPALRTLALVGLIGAAAVVLHPQQQYRFQTTVLPPLWIVAGAGWAMLLGLLTAHVPRLAGDGLTVAAVAAMIVAQIGYKPSAMAYTASIHPRGGNSDYELFRAYRPHLDGAQRIGVVSTGGRSGFYRWTLAENCKCRRPVEQPFTPRDANRGQVQAIAAAWLARTKADTIVALQESNRSRHFGIVHDWMLGQFDALNAQSRFVKIETTNVPQFGEITIWRRSSAAP